MKFENAPGVLYIVCKAGEFFSLLRESFAMLGEALDTFEMRNVNSNGLQPFKEGKKKDLETRLAKSSGLQRYLYLINGVLNHPKHKRFAKDAIREIPFNSPVWNIRSEIFRSAIYRSLEQKELSDVDIANFLVNDKSETLNAFFSKNPNRSAHTVFLKSLLADLADEDVHGRFDFYRKRLAKLLSVSQLERFSESYGRDRKLAVGNQLPHFELNPLNSNHEIVTRKSLAGKYLLIDFWATWCSPCLKEMPYLKEAYVRFQSKNLEIVSISFDRT